MESRIGRPSDRARSSASSPQGYHSTGLSACWSRYGLVSPASRFMRTTIPPDVLRIPPPSQAAAAPRRAGAPSDRCQAPPSRSQAHTSGEGVLLSGVGATARPRSRRSAASKPPEVEGGGSRGNHGFPRALSDDLTDLVD